MTGKKNHIFIFAGELSGDLHGGRLVHALKNHLTDPVFCGVGGPDLRSHGVCGPLTMEDFSVMGFSDVLKSLPRLWKQFRTVRSYILNNNPELVIFIDSPSFSLPMAKSLRKKGFKGKIVQYICPTVWAWGKHRIKEMEKHFDLLLTIYPFEKQYFENTSLKVEYVGNPLQEAIRSHSYNPLWKAEMGIKEEASILALFPGSRIGEIHRNLPIQLEAAKILLEKHPGDVLAISFTNLKNKELIERIILETAVQGDKVMQDFKSESLVVVGDHSQMVKAPTITSDYGLKDCVNLSPSTAVSRIIAKYDSDNQFQVILVPKESSYDLMRNSHCAIAKSGTVTLELALHSCPTAVMYKLSFLNKMIAQYILKVNLPNYCIVNILKNTRIFPELIASGCAPKDIANSLQPLYDLSVAREQCLSQCQEIQQMFHGKDASLQAAQAIAELKLETAVQG